MALTTPPPSSSSSLVDWLTSIPMVEGVRPVDRMPTTTQVPMRRPAYRRQRPPGEPVATAPQQEIVSLVREAGVLRWRAGATATMVGQRRAAGRAALPVGEVVKQYAFERLPTSDVYTALVGLDRILTPLAAYPGMTGNGLRRLQNGVLLPFPDGRQAAGKKILLVLHGTFSNTESLIVNGFQQTAPGRRLLADAEKAYDLVLAFDHPTLSVSPMLNAFDLSALLRPSPANVDVICHSRGGLVARWFCEAYADQSLRRRVVFVGAPLAGTSLAAAPRLKSALDLLTNIADVLRAASDLAAATPLFVAASGLLRVISTVTGLAASTPALDAAIALVPGLDGQSRTGNNQELRRLRANTGTSDFTAGRIRYVSVRGNFEPQGMGWNFLRFFSRPLQRIGDWGAEIIFDGENDLIVDTSSMAEVADNRLVTLAHDFGTTDRVHHTNYFLQPETIRAVRQSFGIG